MGAGSDVLLPIHLHFVRPRPVLYHPQAALHTALEDAPVPFLQLECCRLLLRHPPLRSYPPGVCQTIPGDDPRCEITALEVTVADQPAAVPPDILPSQPPTHNLLHLADRCALYAHVAPHIEGADHRLQKGGVPCMPLDAVLLNYLWVLGDVDAVTDQIPTCQRLDANGAVVLFCILALLQHGPPLLLVQLTCEPAPQLGLETDDALNSQRHTVHRCIEPLLFLPALLLLILQPPRFILPQHACIDQDSGTPPALHSPPGKPAPPGQLQP
mmetsp:Transcript_137401/g.238998  ORF Transcript_137401/g.238998 Transcript_137401/m.238998 type:complete len:270 (-) Transcript_137401:2155-2964(-)